MVKWKSHPDFPDIKISNNGMVYRNGNPVRLYERALFASKRYYFIVNDKVNGVYKSYRYDVHSLVFKLFSGQSIPKGFHIHHKDFNAKNNHINNLELLSPKDHKERHSSLKTKNHIS